MILKIAIIQFCKKCNLQARIILKDGTYSETFVSRRGGYRILNNLKNTCKIDNYEYTYLKDDISKCGMPIEDNDSDVKEESHFSEQKENANTKE